MKKRKTNQYYIQWLEELNDGSYDAVDAETPKLLERHHKIVPD